RVRVSFVVSPRPGLSPLPLHDALPILARSHLRPVDPIRRGIPAERVSAAYQLDPVGQPVDRIALRCGGAPGGCPGIEVNRWTQIDRTSTRLNSSHQIISYAVLCLTKKR